LLAGSRRFQAITELGWKEVDAHVVDRDVLQQELISIDENLVREPLNKLELEKCLNRGREIYEQLNPDANKIDISKTGLSKSVIKSAIKRDALAADSVKQARSQGELNASQTNEIIQLDKGRSKKDH